MKNIIPRLLSLSILLLLFSVYSYSQRRGHQQQDQWESLPMIITENMGRNYTPQNGTLGEYGGQTLAVFEVYSNCNSISSTALGLSKKSVEKLVEVLEKHTKKAKEWSATAQQQGVRSFEKPLYSKLKPGLVDVARMGYVTDGQSFSKSYTSSMTTRNYLQVGYPTFVVNSEGICYLTLASNVGVMKVASNKSVMSSTTVNSGGLLNPQTAIGHTTSREVEDYDIGWVHIYIPITEIDVFLAHLKQLVIDFGKSSNYKKDVDALFK